MSESNAAPAIVEEVLTRPPDEIDVRVPGEAEGGGGTEEPREEPREVIFELEGIEIQYSGVTAVKTSLADLGVDLIGGTPEEFAAYIKSEVPKWTAIIKASGAKVE